MLRSKWSEIMAVIIGIIFIAGVGILVRYSEILNVSEEDTSQTSFVEEISTEEFITTIDTEIKFEDTTVLVEEEIVIKTPITNLIVNGDKIVIDDKKVVSAFWLWNQLRGCKCPYFIENTTDFCKNIEDCKTIWDEATCAAIMGNMEKECGVLYHYQVYFKYEKLGGEDGKHYGLCQWSSLRIKIAKEALGITNINPSAEEQIRILFWELTLTKEKDNDNDNWIKTHSKNYDYQDYSYVKTILFKGCFCSEDKNKCQCCQVIAEIFGRSFEKGGGIKERKEFAQEWYDFFIANTLISD